MKELSVSDIMDFEPCYSEDKVKEVFNGKDKLSLLDILDLDIPTENKVWVLTRPGVLSDAILREFVALTADRAVRQNCLTCGLPAIEAWAAKWLDGSDRSAEAAYAARETAQEAAYDAAEAAVRGAAWAAYYAARAAYGAACYVAWAACEAAACDAAYGAAYRAVYGAAWAARDVAERQQQIADLRRLVEESA